VPPAAFTDGRRGGVGLKVDQEPKKIVREEWSSGFFEMEPDTADIALALAETQGQTS
jgi:hypothetical protein